MTGKVGLGYRSEIDGLRAVAIIGVLLYHLGLGVPGGYVGVDVFFVISGFLISSLIISDLNNDKFSFLHFWERRARRIAPAMIVLVFAVLISGWFILFPVDFRSLGKATLFQSLFSANIFSYRDSGYFAGSSFEKPLLHMWSLAVEEQFYLSVPILLFLLFRYKKTKPKRSIILLLFILMAASLALSEFNTQFAKSAAFYLLPSRAWELLVGSLLVVLPEGVLLVRKRFMQEGLSVIGLFAILVSYFTYSDLTPFPGLSAILPVAGTALIIHANRRGLSENVNTLVGKLLSVWPMIFIGLISYSLYLWHWPIIVMVRHLKLEHLTLHSKLLILIFSIFAAYMSWKFIENPFRLNKIGAGKRIFVWAGTGLSFLALLGVGIVYFNGIPNRFDKQVNSYIKSKHDNSFRTEVTVEAAKQGKFYRIGNPKTEQAPSIFVWGDSHAMMVMEAFDSYLRKRGLSGVAATHSSTPPVLDWYYTSPWGLNTLAPEYNQAVVDFILKNKIKNVFLISSWKSSVQNLDLGGKSFAGPLLKTVSLLESAGIQVYLMLDVPRIEIDVPALLARSHIYHFDYTRFLSSPQDSTYTDGIASSQLDDIRKTGAKVLNPKNAFLSQTGENYLIEKNGYSLYFDKSHLSTHGAMLVYLPFLEKSLDGQLSIETRK